MASRKQRKAKKHTQSKKNPYDSQVAICWHQSMDESARLAICALPHMRQNRQVWAAVYPKFYHDLKAYKASIYQYGSKP